MGIDQQNISKNEENEVPHFIRIFSKEDPEERNRLAKYITGERRSFFAEHEKRKKKLEELISKTENLEGEIEEAIGTLLDLEKKLSTTPWYKFALKKKIACNIENIEEDVDGGLVYKQLDLEHLKIRRKIIYSRINAPYMLPESLLQKIDDFYNIEKLKRKNSEFNSTDIKKYFSDEILEKLTLEEYLLLWERFPSAVQTHVVRQGIRDHVGTNMGFAFHNIGANKYFNGFKELLKDKFLKDTITLSLGDPITKASIEKFINEDSGHFTSKEARIQWLKNLPGKSIGGFDDKTAVHFGINEVLDQFYGAESGNEVFVIFPSAYLTSQHKFTIKNHGFGIDGAENDSFIWPKSTVGIPLNSGIVCIPKNTLVDINTGSKYLLDNHLKPLLKDGKLQLAQDTVSSKQYWEKYFQDNPNDRPARVFYYDGEDTKEALGQLKNINNFERFHKNDHGEFLRSDWKIGEPVHLSGDNLNYRELFPGNTEIETNEYIQRKEDLKKSLEEILVEDRVESV